MQVIRCIHELGSAEAGSRKIGANPRIFVGWELRSICICGNFPCVYSRVAWHGQFIQALDLPFFIQLSPCGLLTQELDIDWAKGEELEERFLIFLLEST